MDCINQPEVLVAGERFHMGITTNIYMKYGGCGEIHFKGKLMLVIDWVNPWEYSL